MTVKGAFKWENWDVKVITCWDIRNKESHHDDNMWGFKAAWIFSLHFRWPEFVVEPKTAGDREERERKQRTPKTGQLHPLLFNTVQILHRRWWPDAMQTDLIWLNLKEDNFSNKTVKGANSHEKKGCAKTGMMYNYLTSGEVVQTMETKLNPAVSSSCLLPMEGCSRATLASSLFSSAEPPSKNAPTTLPSFTQ